MIKKRVKEELGHDLKIVYDDDTSEDDFDEELIALEADDVNDHEQLPGKDLNVNLHVF